MLRHFGLFERNAMFCTPALFICKAWLPLLRLYRAFCHLSAVQLQLASRRVQKQERGTCPALMIAAAWRHTAPTLPANSALQARACGNYRAVAAARTSLSSRCREIERPVCMYGMTGVQNMLRERGGEVKAIQVDVGESEMKKEAL